MAKLAKRFRPESVSDAEWLRYYNHLGAFSHLPSPVKEEARLIDLPARSTVFASGDVAEEMFFLLFGEIRLSRRSRIGDEIAMDIRRQGGFLAEHVLFQHEYDCDAVTLKASKLLTLPRIAFARVLRDTDLGNRWIAYLAGELRLARSRAERLALNTARKRIVHYIGTFGTRGALSMTQTKKDWAVELGLTHEALYRELARMQKEGLLTVEYNKISLTRQRARKLKPGRRD
jgi:CRP-like cAMP-binding protein